MGCAHPKPKVKTWNSTNAESTPGRNHQTPQYHTPPHTGTSGRGSLTPPVQHVPSHSSGFGAAPQYQGSQGYLPPPAVGGAYPPHPQGMYQPPPQAAYGGYGAPSPGPYQYPPPGYGYGGGGYGGGYGHPQPYRQQQGQGMGNKDMMMGAAGGMLAGALLSDALEIDLL